MSDVETETPQTGRRSQRKAAAQAQHVMDRALGKKHTDDAEANNAASDANASSHQPDMPPKKTTKKRKTTKSKEKVYCICRTADDSRPMIQCDDCKEWFHLDCIDLSEVEAESIDKFACAACEHNDKIEKKAKESAKAAKSHSSAKSKSKSESASASPPPRQKRKATPVDDQDSDYDQEESDYEDEAKMDVDQEDEADEPQEEPEDDYADRPAKRRRPERVKPVKRPVKKASPVTETDSHIPKDATRQRIVSAFAAILKPFYVEQNPETAESESASKAAAIEQAIYETTGSDVGQQYKDKFRNLSFNLKDKGNASLAERIVSNALSPTEFATATSEELANPELRNMAEEVRKQSLTGSVLKQVRGPIIRKTHKGEEMVEATVETGAIDNDAKKEAEKSRKEEEDERADLLSRRRDSSATDGQPPTPNSATFPSRARLSGGFEKSPSIEQSSGIPPSPTFPHERSNSAAQSDLDNILSSLRVKKPDPGQKPSDGSSKSPTIDTAKAKNVDLNSVWSHVKSPVVEQTQDSDDSKSPAANGDYNISSTVPARNVTWKGRVHMPAEGHFQADGIQVGGRKRETVREWEAILPAALTIDGRIPIERVSTYLTQMHNTANKELMAVLIKRQPDIEGSANADGYAHLFKYFHEKERYGVVRTTYEVTKDIYLIPLTPDDSLPEYLDYIEDFHVPEADRKEDIFLLVLVYNMTQPAKVTLDKKDRTNAMFIPKDQQKRGHMRPPMRAEPVAAPAPPANIDFKLLESVLGMDPSILANLQQQQAPSQQQAPLHAHPQPPTAPRGPAIHPDRAVHMRGPPARYDDRGPPPPARYDDRGPPRSYPSRGYDDYDRDRRDGPRDRDGRGRGPQRR